MPHVKPSKFSFEFYYVMVPKQLYLELRLSVHFFNSWNHLIQKGVQYEVKSKQRTTQVIKNLQKNLKTLKFVSEAAVGVIFDLWPTDPPLQGGIINFVRHHKTIQP